MMRTRSLPRRTVAAWLGVSPLALAPWSVHARKGGYPDRPVKVIVPFVPGGNADSTARIFAEAYGQRLGQAFVIDNRGGAGGMIGAMQVVRADPDGYTLMIGTTAPIVASWQLAGKGAQYTSADLRPIALLSFVPGVVVVNATSPVKSFQDFVAAAKTREGGLRMGHPGNGTAGHVNILQLQKELRTAFIKAGYKGAGPAVQDLLGNQLDAVATDLPSVLPLVKAGKLRAIGVVFAQRIASVPDVPTMGELRHPAVDIAPFTALMGPRDLPSAIVSRLAEINRAVLADAGLRSRLETIGGIPAPMDTRRFEQFLKEQTTTYAELVRTGLLAAE